MPEEEVNGPDINFVIPLYNEEEGFAALIERLNKVMDDSRHRIEVILIDDGSRDRTPELMRALALSDKRYNALFLSRNFGHQLALSAGLSKVNAADAIFILDGDLQDPPELLDRFYAFIEEGYDVVYAVREKRKESFLKRAAYNGFYRLLKRISYIEIPLDSGDFSLVSRRVIDIMNQMPEESRFLRGMRSWVGFRQIGVPYERQERAMGESKYSFKKLLGLAFNGIFNFSEFPIHFLTWAGSFAVLVSFVYLIVVIVKKLMYDTVPEGFTSLLFIIIFFSGVQLFCLGILGQYLLRIFFQSKQRPLYVEREYISGKDREHGS